MHSSRYFMSDQAENAATAQIIESARAAKEAKTRLEAKMKVLGESLDAFAKALRTPDDNVFDVDSNAITVGRHGSAIERPLARLTPADIDWKDLCDTLRGFNRATEEKRDGIAKLKAIGLSLSE
jgi:hypothetical protein